MTTANHRVIVQVNDIGELVPLLHDLKAHNTNRSGLQSFLNDPNNEPCEVEIIGQKYLMIPSPNKNEEDKLELEFDCVGTATDPHVRIETTALMDQLIIHAINCALIRFSVLRECQMPLLLNLLVNEVDHRLHLMHGCIHTIKLEYYDISKFDVVNVLSKTKYRDPKNRKHHRLRNQYSTTNELAKWLQSEYIHLWDKSHGHECFDMQFIYSDSNRRVHKAKFSIMFLYLGKMDLDTKSGLNSFFENINSNRVLKHSMITACLIDYFNGDENWNTCMIFEIPHMNGILFSEELTMMAAAAYKGIQALMDSMNKSKKSSRHSSRPSRSSAINSDIASAAQKNYNVLYAGSIRHNPTIPDPSSETRRGTDRTVAFAPPIFMPNQVKRKETLSNRDFNNLSSWYFKIDEKYNLVVAAMENYYQQKYDHKINKMCLDIRQMMKTTYDAEADEKAADEKCSIKLEGFYEIYREALAGFRSLLREIETSLYTDLLKVYLKTKNYELSQYALSTKMKHLERCQQELSGAISNEVQALNRLKRANMRTRSVALTH